MTASAVRRWALARVAAAPPGRARWCPAEPVLGASLPRVWRRAIQGALLAFGGPAGWLALRVATGHGAGAELAASAPLYLYMLLGSAVAFAGFGAVLGRHEDCLVQANRALDELSVSDPITGMRNARYFRARLREEQARTGRVGETLSIVVMDLDRFKRVNDRHGHLVGDEVLLAVAGAITSTVRAGDTAAALRGTAARMGGEEFALLLPDTTGDEARAIAERVRHAVREAVVRLDDGTAVRTTISCGVASGVPAGPDAGQAIYAAADAAMYQAKRAGRDRTVQHQLEPAGTLPATV
ncbi:MAG TPA: GGDEF domain-containing protein [Longimicrobium sp.]|nr:GGDEF domain-containing protein [Longimicrobium sp.]